MEELAHESRETLLNVLFDLMEKSASIKTLPPERKEVIREKYRQAPLDRIVSGIKMLNDDIAKKEKLEAKAKNDLAKNIDAREKLQMQAKKEQSDSEKHATVILKELENVGKPVEKNHKSHKLIWLIACCMIAVVAFFLYKKYI